MGPDLSTENILQSISAALHVNTGPVVGQGAGKHAIMKNPGINMDTQQPHIHQVNYIYRDRFSLGFSNINVGG